LAVEEVNSRDLNVFLGYSRKYYYLTIGDIVIFYLRCTDPLPIQVIDVGLAIFSITVSAGVGWFTPAQTGCTFMKLRNDRGVEYILMVNNI